MTKVCAMVAVNASLLTPSPPVESEGVSSNLHDHLEELYNAPSNFREGFCGVSLPEQEFGYSLFPKSASPNTRYFQAAEEPPTPPRRTKNI